MALLVATGCSRTPDEQYARALQAAKKRLEVQDDARAILHLQNAVKLRPEAAEPHYLLGMAYLNQLKLREAVMSLRKATELKADYPEAQLKLAELMIRTQNERLAREAQSRIQNVLTGHPSDNDALFMLAATQLQLGKREDAEKYLSEVHQRAPQHLKAAIALAEVKLAENDIGAAESILQGTVQRAPQSSLAAAALGMLHTQTGKLSEAAAMFQRAFHVDPSNAQALRGLAALQVKNRDLAAAEATYRKIAALPQSENKLAYALFLMHQGRRADATAEFERLVRQAPGDRIIRSGLVAAYLAGDRFDDAEKLLDTALQHSPCASRQLPLPARHGRTAAAAHHVDHRASPGQQARWLASRPHRLQTAARIAPRCPDPGWLLTAKSRLESSSHPQLIGALAQHLLSVPATGVWRDASFAARLLQRARDLQSN